MKKLIMALVLMPMMALADTETVDGITWTYTVSDGQASVGGEDWTIPAVPRETVGAIVIPSTLGGCPVTSIKADAFEDCRGLTSVTIPSSVTYIGMCAFSCCVGLTSVTIPSSVTSIEVGAFFCCVGLTSVTIPSSVTSIEMDAFSCCYGLTSVTIPPSVVNIGCQAFEGCSGLETVVFAEPSALESIDDRAFHDAWSLRKMEIPASVKNIAPEAFIDTPNVTINSGNEAYEIANGVLCDKRTQTVVGGTGDKAEVTIPSSITGIGERAFGGSFVLCQVTIPSSVTSIGGSAFWWCYNLTNVTFEAGSQLETIGNSAYSSSSHLGEIEIPASVKTIGVMAFCECSALSKVTVWATTPPELGERAFDSCAEDLTIYVPYGTLAAYATAEGWKNYAKKFVEMGSLGELTIDWGQKSFVYDGQPKEPVITVKDGATTLTKGTHYLVEYKDNVNVGTAKAIVKGIDPYVGEVTNEFTIVKGDLPPGDDPDPLPPGVDPDDPGQREDPTIPFSAFDYVGMYDGAYHTIDTNGLRAAWTAALGAVTVGYSTASNGTYQATAFLFKDSVVTSYWYKVTSANYADVVKPCKVAVTPRNISNVTMADIPDQEHTGGAIKPDIVVTDGNPSIVSPADYNVAYSDNVNVGTATVTLTGKRNYAGTKTVTFKIVSSAADLKAEIVWKLLKASGTYMAQLKVTCTSGLATGISNLRFMFADRVSDGVTTAALWDTPSRAAKATTMSYGGETYRYVVLDASRITAENVAVTYGVSNLAATSIPTAERTIELYVRKRVNPTTGKEEAAGVDNFVGYVSWVSGGETSYLPVVAGAQAVSLSKAALRASAPMKLSAVNTALAVGSVVDEGSCPYCKLTEFAVSDNEITGVVEVGAVSSDGTEYPGKLGPNVTVTLLGTNDLGQDFMAICSVTTDSAGRFRLAKPKDCQFFKLKLTVEEVIE